MSQQETGALTSGVATDAPDVSGVPAVQLQAIFNEYLDTDLNVIAEKVGIDLPYLHHLVVEPKYQVIKLGMADRILSALDLNVSTLIYHGELTVVPLRPSRSSALRIVDSEIEFAAELDLPPMTQEQQEARIAELLAEYNEHCGSLTEAQIKRREADRLRKQAKKQANENP